MGVVVTDEQFHLLGQLSIEEGLVLLNASNSVQFREVPLVGFAIGKVLDYLREVNFVDAQWRKSSNACVRGVAMAYSVDGFAVH